MSLQKYIAELASRERLTVVGPLHLRVKEAGDHYIDLYRMLYNWRLVCASVNDPGFFDRGWCYMGADSFKVALEEARKWPSDESWRYIPERWYKDVQTGEIQPQFFRGYKPYQGIQGETEGVRA